MDIFFLFRAMVGVEGYKGFPEQFDDLCHTTVEPYVLFRETHLG